MADSVIIPHIIGTTAIIVLFFTMATFWNGYFTNLNVQAYKAQLGQVADYFTSNLNDLIALSKITAGDLFLVNEMKVPSIIGEKLYNISLIKTLAPDGNKQIISVTTSIASLNIYAVSELMWSPDLNIQIYSNQSIPDAALHNATLSKYLLSDAALSEAARTRGNASIVVWCSKTNDVTVIGLGVKDNPGG